MVLKDFVNFTNSFCSTRMWPLSLLALRQVTKNLQIDRDYRNHGSILRCSRAKDVSNVDNSISESKDEGSQNLQDALKNHNTLFLKHVKIKKRHEIQEIARVLSFKFFKIKF